MDCVFCKIISGDLPSTKIYEDSQALVIENIKPVAKVHLLVLPKKHIDSFEDTSNLKNIVNFSFDQLTLAINKVINKLELKDYKIVINAGKYQSIKHLHLHLLAGNLEGDDILNNT